MLEGDTVPEVLLQSSSETIFSTGIQNESVPEAQKFKRIDWSMTSWPEKLQHFRSNFAMFSDKVDALVETVEKNGTFTVFFSSPFDGCEVERDYFMKRYFTTLEKLLMEPGVTFRVAELRWGMTEAMARKDLTVLACMQTIDKSDVVLEYFGAR